jgi:calcium-dependent protein kinase
MGICQSAEATVLVLDVPSNKNISAVYDKYKDVPRTISVVLDESWNEKEAAPEVESSFTYQAGTCALEYWEPVKELGEGSISSIHLVKRRKHRIDVPYKEQVDIMSLAATGDGGTNETADKEQRSDEVEEFFALKSIIKDNVRNERFLEEMRNEIHNMSQLNHPNIAKVYEAYERHRHIYLIMEYCRGGDLSGEREFTEEQAAAIIYKILSAVAYLHAHNVVHRDLKLENIMFDKNPTNSQDAEIKIIDFGLATRYLSDDHKQMTDKVGTLYSMAPQVLQGVYDSKCDLWSVGVIAYLLLTGGKQPFWGPPREVAWEQRRKIMVDRIMRCSYTRMTGPKWANISPEAKFFVRTLLRMDPTTRPSAAKALESMWMLKYKEDINTINLQHENVYEKITELQQTARILIATKLTNRAVIQLKQKCEELDEAESGIIGLKEFVAILHGTDLTSDEISTIKESFATEEVNEARIRYQDLTVKILESKQTSESERITKAFSKLDVGNTERVPKEKLLETLRESTLETIHDEVVAGVHQDDQGLVSLKDVLSGMGEKGAELLQEAMINGQQDPLAEEELINENDAVIPGGKNDPRDERPGYVFDVESSSLRKSS